jgi:hypothetical protein
MLAREATVRDDNTAREHLVNTGRKEGAFPIMPDNIEEQSVFPQ